MPGEGLAHLSRRNIGKRVRRGLSRNDNSGNAC